MKAKTESHKQKISKSKIEAFKKRFIEKFKFQINEKILSLQTSTTALLKERAVFCAFELL